MGVISPPELGVNTDDFLRKILPELLSTHRDMPLMRWETRIITPGEISPNARFMVVAMLHLTLLLRKSRKRSGLCMDCRCVSVSQLCAQQPVWARIVGHLHKGYIDESTDQAAATITAVCIEDVVDRARCAYNIIFRRFIILLNTEGMKILLSTH
jgi:hypothetical protein